MDNVIGPRQRLLLQRLDDSPEASLMIGLLTAGRRLDAAFNTVLGTHDLSGGRFATLLAVTSHPGLTISGLAEQTEVTAATASGLVESLVKRGLVVRTVGENDRRVQTLTATEAGHTLIAEAVPAIGTWLAGLASGIDEASREGAQRTFSRLLSHLDGDDPHSATP